ncbi:hypothetical protein FPZ12_041950 [Amycolatopsis acidicola]|uniref:Ig-like domain repeat protein n=1 Tax=Amycolatopsis acidicola TaxID=2596893 RepID=A0A5N0URB3_9PSEU|nr:hypothetical protein [Amycolatopsis acidicola]KAA9150092.1 hypothetical protein FPZ12_041950 [Amycolatopsis acidicola]
MVHKTGIFLGATLLALAGGVLSAPVASATAPPPTLRVSPATVQPGGTLNFTATCYGSPSSLTSPGLAGAVTLKPGQSPGFTGTGKAGEKPGTYTATFNCETGLPAAHGPASVQFTVACRPTTKPTSPTTTEPPESSASPEPTTGAPDSPTATTEPEVTTAAVAPAAVVSCGSTGTGSGSTAPAPAPQVKVLPKGAPETGDGSEAAAA